MYYLVLIVFSFLFFLYGYKQNKLFSLLTSGELFISAESLGVVRSYIYIFSVAISLIIDTVNNISGLIEYSSIGNPFTPLSLVFGTVYGASAATQVFFALLVEVVCTCLVCFFRGLSVKMIIKYIADGKCIKYRYIKRLTIVLMLAFLAQILLIFSVAAESDLMIRLTGETYVNDFPRNIIAYNMIWISAFMALSKSYKNKIKLFGSVHLIEETKKNDDIPKNIINVECVNESQKTIDSETSAAEAKKSLYSDEARLAELTEEIKKIPVAKVKKWHEEGKLTDEQYKAIARKYNSMLKERDEIQERMELLKSINSD